MMKDVAQTTSLFPFVTNIVLQLYLLKLTLTLLLFNAQQQQTVCHNNKRLSGLKYVYKEFSGTRTCCNRAKHSCTKQVKLFSFLFLLTNQLWPFRVDILVLHTPPMTNKKTIPLKSRNKKLQTVCLYVVVVVVLRSTGWHFQIIEVDLLCVCVIIRCCVRLCVCVCVLSGQLWADSPAQQRFPVFWLDKKKYKQM